jgi:hypothetical protein
MIPAANSYEPRIFAASSAAGRDAEDCAATRAFASLAAPLIDGCLCRRVMRNSSLAWGEFRTGETRRVGAK